MNSRFFLEIGKSPHLIEIQNLSGGQNGEDFAKVTYPFESTP